MKLKVNVVEEYTVFQNYESIEIDTEMYPELKGKSEDEIKAHIRKNAFEMKPVNSDFDTLGEELIEQDFHQHHCPIVKEFEFGN